MAYATFKDIKTNEEITIFNTHLDHIGTVSKEKSVKLILDILDECKTPYMLAGDFNFTSISNNYKELTKKIDDTKDIALSSMKYGTINYNYNWNMFHFIRIDYIFSSKDDFVITNYLVDPSFKYEGKPVSDHFPVIVDFKIKE